MKKIFSQKLILFLFAMMLFSGCANDQYAIEKEYWWLKKQANEIFKNPFSTPPRQVEVAVAKFNNFIRRHPTSPMALDAEFTIARIYQSKEQYAAAREQLNTVLNKHAKSDQICAETIFLIGNTYEAEDKWPLALEKYKAVIQKYPMTQRGFSIPMYIPAYYKSKFQPEKMVAAYQEAIDHYRNIAHRFTNSPIGYQAYNLVADCYIGMNDWPNAISTYNTMLFKYKGKLPLDTLQMTMAMIYSREMQDTANAKIKLQELLKEYPHSRFASQAKKFLKELEKK